jgi:hypothetical protein
MQTTSRKNVSIVCVSPSPAHVGPVGSDEYRVAAVQLEEILSKNSPAGSFARVQEGVLLVDMDACYPGVVALTSHCARVGFKARLAIFGCGDDPAVLSPFLPGPMGFLESVGQRVRMLMNPPKQAD